MKPIDEKTYFDQIGIHGDLGSDLKEIRLLGLKKWVYQFKNFIMKYHPGQQEISLRYSDSVTMADNIQTFKIIVKEIAMLSNVLLLLCQNLLKNLKETECTLHISLLKTKKNLFAQNSLKSGISK